MILPKRRHWHDGVRGRPAPSLDVAGERGVDGLVVTRAFPGVEKSLASELAPEDEARLAPREGRLRACRTGRSPARATRSRSRTASVGHPSSRSRPRTTSRAQRRTLRGAPPRPPARRPRPLPATSRPARRGCTSCAMRRANRNARRGRRTSASTRSSSRPRTGAGLRGVGRASIPTRSTVGPARRSTTSPSQRLPFLWTRVPAPPTTSSEGGRVTASSSSSFRARPSILSARRCSPRGPAGSATTPAAPGTRRAPGRSSAAREPTRRSASPAARSACAELRLETVYPAEREQDVLRALREAHPYEEPAFDLYQLAAAGLVNVRLSTDGGARGNPGPAAAAYVLEAEDGTVLAAEGESIGVGHEQRRRVPGAPRRAREGGRARARAARGRLRLRAPREADARASTR